METNIPIFIKTINTGHTDVYLNLNKIRTFNKNRVTDAIYATIDDDEWYSISIGVWEKLKPTLGID
jgi:hypothetical protein